MITQTFTFLYVNVMTPMDPQRITLIGIALDESSSMGKVSTAAISGTNEFVAGQNPANNDRLGQNKTLLGIVLFNTTARWVTQHENQHDGNVTEHYKFYDVAEYKDLTDKTYRPGGMTALYDAIDTLIRGADLYRVDHPDLEVDVVIVIQTDGEENSSRHCTQDEINKLILARTEIGYTFTYLGANQDACFMARTIGIKSAISYTNDINCTRTAMRSASEAVSRYRSQGAQVSDQIEYSELERIASMQQIDAAPILAPASVDTNPVLSAVI